MCARSRYVISGCVDGFRSQIAWIRLDASDFSEMKLCILPKIVSVICIGGWVQHLNNLQLLGAMRNEWKSLQQSTISLVDYYYWLNGCVVFGKRMIYLSSGRIHMRTGVCKLFNVISVIRCTIVCHSFAHAQLGRIRAPRWFIYANQPLLNYITCILITPLP